MLNLSQVAINGEVLTRQLFYDLILALDVLAKAVVFILHGGLFLQNFNEFFLDNFLLLHHLSVRGIDFLLHLLAMLTAELELFLELEDVARTGFDAHHVFFLSLKLGAQRLHLRVVALHLALEQLLLEFSVGQLLFQLTVLADE